MISRMIFFLCLIVTVSCSSANPEIQWVDDDEIDISKIINKEFDRKVLDNLGLNNSNDNQGGIGVLRISHNDSLDLNTPSICRCVIENNKIRIINSVGLMGGVGVEIQIDLNSNYFVAKLIYETDGEKIYKAIPEEDFKEDFEIKMVSSKLLITESSEFYENRLMKGKLIGMTSEYYEKGLYGGGDIRIITDVESIFECTLFKK